MNTITSESAAMNRYGTIFDKITNTMYSMGAPGLAIWMRKNVTMAKKTTNTNDTIAKKRATLPMILEFFKR